MPALRGPPGERLPAWEAGATWRSGDAAACKAVYAGSIPAVASTTSINAFDLKRLGLTLDTSYTLLDTYCSICVPATFFIAAIALRR